jgi:hypothetical protein
MKTPVLFTQLEPTKSLFDDKGNRIDPLEVEIDTLYRALTG